MYIPVHTCIFKWVPLWQNKNVINFKQAAISQMEKDLNQRTQDVKERDKEVGERMGHCYGNTFNFSFC